MFRRNIMGKKNKHKEENLNSFIYVSGGILGIVMIAIIVTFFAYAAKIRKNSNSSNLEQAKVTELSSNNTETESASTEIGKTVEEAKNELINSATEQNKDIAVQTQNDTAQVSQNKVEENTITETKEQEVKKEKKIEFIYPVEGEIIKEFAKDNLIYSETLKEWITHTGIDIKADKTTVIKASAEGTVIGIKNDPRYGLTVIIEHESGYKTVYSNLLTSEFVNEGDKVDAGETIGTVGTTGIFESAEDAHVHFEILKDNEYQDPITLLNHNVEE